MLKNCSGKLKIKGLPFFETWSIFICYVHIPSFFHHDDTQYSIQRATGDFSGSCWQVPDMFNLGIPSKNTRGSMRLKSATEMMGLAFEICTEKGLY